MEGKIARSVNYQWVTIAINTAITGVIDVLGYADGAVLIPSAWTDANLGFQMPPDTGTTGTFLALKDESGNPVQISGITTNAAFWYAIPARVFPAATIKLWSKSTTAATVTDTNQGAARSILVVLKS